MPDNPIQTSPAPLIVLFDGTCGLCSSSINFILRHDPNQKFRFAPLQSQIARDLMAEHKIDPDQMETMVVIEGNRAYLRSNAALRIAIELPDPWPLAALAVYIPEPLRDAAYNFIARHRKQWFKPPDACRSPTPQEREQFLA